MTAAESDLSISRFQVIVLFQRQLRIHRNYNAPDDQNAVNWLVMLVMHSKHTVVWNLQAVDDVRKVEQ